MLRKGLAAGLAGLTLLGGGPPSAGADPIEDSARALWSAVKSATSSKPGRRKSTSSMNANANADQEPIPPLPVRKNAQKGAKAETEQAAAPEPPPDVWQPAEIAAAQARCAALLKTIDAEVIPELPFKKGKCGSAAPIRLVSLGKTSKVKFSPPALVNCKMAAALSKWIVGDVQPLAKKHLGATVTTVEVMSDYSCRGSFGRVKNRLSEHSFANALDIRGFATTNVRPMRVLADWGLTQRDIAKHVAEAKAEAQMALAQTADASKTNKGSLVQKVAANVPGNTAVQAHDTKPNASAGELGGPNSPLSRKAARTAKIEAISLQIPSAATTRGSRFLRDVHDAACRIFGTTLGPEANEAHRNHFHVDMAERKYKKICD